MTPELASSVDELVITIGVIKTGELRRLILRSEATAEDIGYRRACDDLGVTLVDLRESARRGMNT